MSDTKEITWHDLSDSALDTMRELGNFGPTASVKDRMVKGYTLDDEGEGGKKYWSSRDLRVIASDLIDVANWLDRRAETPTPPTSDE